MGWCPMDTVAEDHWCRNADKRHSPPTPNMCLLCAASRDETALGKDVKEEAENLMIQLRGKAPFSNLRILPSGCHFVLEDI